MKTKIYIGAGHGGTDSGAVGVDGVLEKNLTLAVAKCLTCGLKKAGYKVVLSRYNDVTKNTVVKMTEAAAARCDLMIDIHFNAFNKSANGTEIYYPHNDQNAERIAGSMSKLIARNLGIKNRGAKIKLSEAIDYFGVCRYGGLGFLVECCFIDSATDMIKYNSPCGAEKCAAAICKVITDNFD